MPEDYSKLPKSRKEARASGSLHFFTGIPCRFGHITFRYTSSYACYLCNKIFVANDYRKPGGRGMVSSRVSKRRSKLLGSTPEWADMEAIREFYKGCPKGYHVDHIIPLQNGVFPSVHSLENLQYLPAQENFSKRNNVDPLSLRHYPCCVLPEYRSYVSPQSAGAFVGVLKFDPEDDKMKETP